MSKQPKPAKRRASAGERLVMKRLAKTLPGICNGIDDLRYKAVLEQPRSDAKEHDRAIRAAVKEAWYAGLWAGKCREFYQSHMVRVPLEKKYGVKL